jgi:hypothetical protein
VNLIEGKRRKEMKVVKCILKIILWIVKIPVLPLILAWKWSKGKKLGVVTSSGGQKGEATEIPGLGRLIYTIVYAAIMYFVIFHVLIFGIGFIMSSLNKETNEDKVKESVPIVQQTNAQNANN